MVCREVTVKNRAGIHARPAALLVEVASGFSCEVYIVKDGARINAKSIMGILTLGAAYNTSMTVQTEGTDENEALEALVHLFETRFEEA